MWVNGYIIRCGSFTKNGGCDGGSRRNRSLASACAVVTILVRDDEPNEATRQAIEEPIADLPGFESVDALFEELET
jgi:hypothetical protein